MSPVPRLLEWLEEPRADRGIHFAAGEDGWEWWPYARLAELARRTAAGLAGAGIGDGDVVALVQRSGPSFVASLFGAMLAGATPAPIAPPQLFGEAGAYAEHALGLLAQAAPAALVGSADLHGTLAPLAAAAGAELLDAEALHRAPAEVRRRRARELALVQFTSGTSARARGVAVRFDALHANIEAIRRWLGMGGEEGTASWLPVHHDMGLIGCLLTPIANASELWLMLPEQFLRRPLRYLRCFAAGDAHLTSMPSFGLAYIARRVPAAALAGLDFSAWRAIIVGAERIDPLALRRFTALLGPAGLSPAALRPAYGLAEATLAVTGVAMGERWRALGVKPGTLALGRRVSVASGGADVVGCGRPLAGVGVEIRDVRGRPAGEGVVGEVVVAGPAVAGGYLVADPGSPTRIAGGEVRTGDAGFLLDGELFVLGRLGDSLKVRGRHVFAEDLELALVHAGVPAHRLTVLLGDHAGVPTAIAVLERVGAEWGAQAESILRRGAEHARIVVVDAPRGTIQRTSSGKPRRRRLWREFVEDRLAGEVLLDRRPPGASRPDNQPTPDPRGTYV